MTMVTKTAIISVERTPIGVDRLRDRPGWVRNPTQEALYNLFALDHYARTR
jgi:hypothetical protein